MPFFTVLESSKKISNFGLIPFFSKKISSIFFISEVVEPPKIAIFFAIKFH